MWEALRCCEPITIIAVGLGIIRPDPLTGILTPGMKMASWWLPHHSLHPREAWYPWPLQFYLSLAQPSAVKVWPWNSYLILKCILSTGVLFQSYLPLQCRKVLEFVCHMEEGLIPESRGQLSKGAYNSMDAYVLEQPYDKLYFSSTKRESCFPLKQGAIFQSKLKTSEYRPFSK